jgi:serine phosphatase RsbU (regulator of sigma subunit)
MKLSILDIKVDKSAGWFRRALQYALYDWAQGMSWSRRLLTMLSLLIQLAALTLALIVPKHRPLLFLALLIWVVGLFLMNGTLTAEFVRKMQLEADQIAAEQIQRTLHPQKAAELPGYQLEMFYKPLRGVGGDYFDVIELSDGQTLFAIADVSGKGMPAALLAANIQALVRSISNVASDPLFLANQVNTHLCRYTPPERFATAVFALLSRETGELTYVNAGQNPPILSTNGRAVLLESTGMPLGLIHGADFKCQKVVIPPGGTLLFFTDGLTDGIGGEKPEERVCEVIAGKPASAISNLQSLLSPNFNDDDITILLLTRHAGATAAVAGNKSRAGTNESGSLL